MGPYAGVDFNLTLCPLQRRLQHNYEYYGQPYARVDFIPQSGTLNWPQISGEGFFLEVAALIDVSLE